MELFFQEQKGVSAFGTLFPQYSLSIHDNKDVAVKKMKKLIGVIAIIAMLSALMLCVGAVSAAEEPVSPGPAGDIDGIPEGLQYGPGPAPNSHDGIPDGPGWP